MGSNPQPPRASEPPGQGERQSLPLLIEVVRTRLFLGLLVLAGSGLGAVYLSFTARLRPLGEFWVYLVREVGIALLLGGAATWLVRVFLLRYYRRFESEMERFVREDVTARLEDISKDIKGETEELVRAAKSLEAMRESGILRVYARRSAASDEIARDLTDASVSQIRLIGVSLNDFVLDYQPALNAAWRVLEEYIRGERRLPGRGRKLDIKAMVVDPYCLGAQLRMQAEQREPTAIARRLQIDVQNTVAHLSDLKRANQAVGDTGVTFDFRLYRLPPILFLCRTDTVSYLQQYYFCTSRHADVPNPLLRYHDLPEAPHARSLHHEMQVHFDWIWDNASVAADAWLNAKSAGSDQGLHAAGVVNVFSNPEQAHARMLWLVTNAKKRLYVQGVSLHSFFSFGPLFNALADLAARGNIDVRVLLLDPDCEQAYYRSYREHLLAERSMTFEAYRSDPSLHVRSRLYQDTQDSINNIRVLLAPKAKGAFQVRLYAAAPACFMLLVDDCVLLEQYHYGKIQPGQGDSLPTILGKDMPLVEYAATPSRLYASDPLRNPFALLENHFEFVFNRCARQVDLTAGPP